MKKRNFIAIATAALTLSSMFGIAACDENEGKSANTTARDIYALSAVTSISYLTSASGNAQTASVALAAATETPSSITSTDINDIKSGLSLFEGVIAGGGVEQTVKQNSSTDEKLSQYTFEMTISMPDNTKLCAMYFNETDVRTEKEIKFGVEEVEVSTRFVGVVVVGNAYYPIEGEHEVETEGKEKESEVEFRTYRSADGSTAKDGRNYVVVSQSVEDKEIEYEYTLYKDGAKVKELELEYEEERGRAEVEFQCKDISSGTRNTTYYRIKKSSDGFTVILRKNGSTSTIEVTPTENGYKFQYENGFEEIV